MDNITLIPITVPALTSVEYGKNLNEQFDNINKNFNTLANYEYIKGQDGKSINVQNVKLSDNSAIKTLIENAITEYAGGSIPPINGINIFDGLENYIITIIYDIPNQFEESTIVGSMPMIFYDPRFYSQKLTDNQDLYINQVDLSGVICWDAENNSFKFVQTFPTLYFDDEIVPPSFCWKINGVETGLVANGPAGQSGSNSSIILCIREEKTIEDNKIYNITKIQESGEFVNVTSEMVEKYNGYVALVFANDDASDENKNKYWVSTLFAENGKLTAICSDTNVIKSDIDSIALFNILKNMTAYGNDKLKGIFFPINDTAAHIIYAENDDYSNNNHRNIIIKPVDNINNLDSNPNNWTSYSNSPSIKILYPRIIATGSIQSNTNISSNTMSVNRLTVGSDITPGYMVVYGDSEFFGKIISTSADIDNIYSDSIESKNLNITKTSNLSGVINISDTININGDVNINNKGNDNNIYIGSSNTKNIYIESQKIDINGHKGINTNILNTNKLNATDNTDLSGPDITIGYNSYIPDQTFGYSNINIIGVNPDQSYGSQQGHYGGANVLGQLNIRNLDLENPEYNMTNNITFWNDNLDTECNSSISLTDDGFIIDATNGDISELTIKKSENNLIKLNNDLNIKYRDLYINDNIIASDYIFKIKSNSASYAALASELLIQFSTTLFNGINVISKSVYNISEKIINIRDEQGIESSGLIYKKFIFKNGYLLIDNITTNDYNEYALIFSGQISCYIKDEENNNFSGYKLYNLNLTINFNKEMYESTTPNYISIFNINVDNNILSV